MMESGRRKRGKLMGEGREGERSGGCKRERGQRRQNA